MKSIKDILGLILAITVLVSSSGCTAFQAMAVGAGVAFAGSQCKSRSGSTSSRNYVSKTKHVKKTCSSSRSKSASSGPGKTYSHIKVKHPYKSSHKHSSDYGSSDSSHMKEIKKGLKAFRKFEYEDAAQHLERASRSSKLTPRQRGQVHLYKGASYFYSGDKEKAGKEIKKARELGSGIKKGIFRPEIEEMYHGKGK